MQRGKKRRSGRPLDSSRPGQGRAIVCSAVNWHHCPSQWLVNSARLPRGLCSHRLAIVEIGGKVGIQMGGLLDMPLWQCLCPNGWARHRM